MSRHRLSAEEMLAGTRAALRSKKTPAAFRPALRKRVRELERKVGKGARRPVRRPRFLGWFDF